MQLAQSHSLLPDLPLCQLTHILKYTDILAHVATCMCGVWWWWCVVYGGGGGVWCMVVVVVYGGGGGV